MKKTALALILSLTALPVCADLARDLESLVGYTIVASKTIAGYHDKTGALQSGFEGCEFDRVIVFDDGNMLRCAATGYETGFRPRAIVLSNGPQLKMIVGGNVYDMKK